VTRDELVRSRREAWERLRSILERVDGARGLRRIAPAEIRELSELYRSLAADLMGVRRDKLGADLERHLDALANRAHNVLYAGSGVGNRTRPIDLILDFPNAVRRNIAFFLIACALFYVPGGLAGVAAYTDESYALAVMSSAQLEAVEHMYSSADPSRRDTNTDAAMTGFYVNNNVGIAFRCFATGLAFGLGSMFYLLYNGLFIGVVFGHLVRSGLGEQIFSFVSLHSPWELTAIVISGGAGIQMGYALVSTKGRTRLGNLQAHGLELLRQIAGAALFLLIAALIEGNLSPSAIPPLAKYVLGGVGWVMVAGVLFLSGHGRRPPPDVVALREGSAA
jgi:uncharacterized membrane protein SpoIIM required for sporulation